MAIREWTSEEQERYDLAKERLLQIPSEQTMSGPLQMFFSQEARFLLRMEDLREALEIEGLEDASLEELQTLNRELYEEILPEHYATCFGNPDRAVEAFGKDLGQVLCVLYRELRGAIVYAYENRKWDLLVLMELLLQMHGTCIEGTPSAKTLREIFYWYAYDYSEDFLSDRIRETLDPSPSFAGEIIETADLEDLRYLYRYGEYISENELKTASFLNGLPQEEIDAIARTWTEGFRKGFEAQKKPLEKKKTAMIEYRIGFERVVRSAVRQLRVMGLETIFYRTPAHLVNAKSRRAGYTGTAANPQYPYDHRADQALLLDARFVTRRLQATQQAYEQVKDLALVHAGPLVWEVFGETPFEPEVKESACRLSSEQEKLQVRLTNEATQIAFRYIPMEERSFTIIAYPVPEIGENFAAIFRETMRINNLDSLQYQRIQQHLIDALDRGTAVQITGRNGNETDLTVQLHSLTDPSKQTNFENCVADVNIPVGEVFTSPVLQGTNGLLHVGRVALEGMRFTDLRLRIKDGMITEYGCGNFADPAQGREYINERILFHHETLPMGEFAIGTNTTAYQVAEKYQIAEILPILIAEKMGPHFAFGDTCYSWQEELAVFNPDGKEIIARDNECSIRRKEDPSAAYFDCHTDITIPYDELGSITVLCRDGSRIVLIENGRFVLPGTEELNAPLEA